MKRPLWEDGGPRTPLNYYLEQLEKYADWLEDENVKIRAAVSLYLDMGMDLKEAIGEE